MRILMVSAHPPIDSELVREWTSMGHEVNLISLSVPWQDQYSNLISATRGLPCAKPDVIICGAVRDLYLSFAIKFVKRWSTTKILIIHWWFPPKKFILHFVNNISVCNYERNYLLKLMKIRSKVAYCPVDVDYFNPNGNVEKKRILAIGNDFKNRDIMGYDHLINIIKLVHQIDPTINIGIAGNNSKEDFPDYVKLYNLRKEELLSEINKSSVCFFTTTRNLIMNSLQIAMSCEKNVVLFDLEPFREVIEDGVSGYLIPDFNDHLFAAKLVTLSNSPDEKVGKMARNSIITKCERKKVASQILDF